MILELVRKHYIFPFSFFINTNEFLSNKLNDRRMAANFTSLIHATGSTALTLSYLLKKSQNNYLNMLSFSSGYFLYDTYNILRFWKPSILNYCYIYHHFASLYLLHEKPNISHGPEILFWGELSNLPSYLVYYYQKKGKNKKFLKKLKYIQFLTYSFIRVPILTKILINFIRNVNKSQIENNSEITDIKQRSIYSFCVGLPVYIMGLIWTSKLYKQL
jgi:hypothetical protein